MPHHTLISSNSLTGKYKLSPLKVIVFNIDKVLSFTINLFQLWINDKLHSNKTKIITLKVIEVSYHINMKIEKG